MDVISIVGRPIEYDELEDYSNFTFALLYNDNNNRSFSIFKISVDCIDDSNTFTTGCTIYRCVYSSYNETITNDPMGPFVVNGDYDGGITRCKDYLYYAHKNKVPLSNYFYENGPEKNNEDISMYPAYEIILMLESDIVSYIFKKRIIELNVSEDYAYKASEVYWDEMKDLLTTSEYMMINGVDV